MKNLNRLNRFMYNATISLFLATLLMILVCFWRVLIGLAFKV